MKLSVLMPAYNEVAHIPRIIERIAGALPGVDKELIIVDDGSTDGTRAFLLAQFAPIFTETDASAPAHERRPGTAFSPELEVKVVFHDVNKGKGGALQTAMALACGDLLVVQDADLEYDPMDWTTMYDLIAVRQVADVVYGSRFYGRPHRSLNFHHYVGNRIISRLFSVLYNQTLNDIEVCYKMFTRDVLASLAITQCDFGFEIQISSQIAKGNWRIYETGISYLGRSYGEGKKVSWIDGVKALWYLIKFRFVW